MSPNVSQSIYVSKFRITFHSLPEVRKSISRHEQNINCVVSINANILVNILIAIKLQIRSTDYLLEERILHEFPHHGAKERHVVFRLLFNRIHQTCHSVRWDRLRYL